MAKWVKNLPANAGDTEDLSLMPGSGRSPGGGNGNPLQYSYLENPMDRGAWQAIVHGVAKSQTCLSIDACIGTTCNEFKFYSHIFHYMLGHCKKQ